MCGEWVQFNDWDARGQPSRARRLAREREGWRHTKDGKDLCRKHTGMDKSAERDEATKHCGTSYRHSNTHVNNSMGCIHSSRNNGDSDVPLRR